jgi:hypothetical protein
VPYQDPTGVVVSELGARAHGAYALATQACARIASALVGVVLVVVVARSGPALTYEPGMVNPP